MILHKEISTIAEIQKIPKSTIDKDWVLGHFLAAIYCDPELREVLVFKGAFTGIDQLINQANYKSLKAAWKNSLAHQLPPAFDQLRDLQFQLSGNPGEDEPGLLHETKYFWKQAHWLLLFTLKIVDKSVIVRF